MLKKIVNIYPKIFIAGGLPKKNLTYEADTRSENEIKDDFTGKNLILIIDFFYFDVLSSIREIFDCKNSILI